MVRTKAEIRAFLNSQVGKSVNAKCGKYQGQCVSLPKALLEFLGVPNPYAARGDAKNYANTLLAQNIAENGKGWLTVVVNPNMGVIDGIRYGHIWLDLKDEANYEQNGARALITTKNTRPISQGQQFVNLDKWIKGGDDVSKPTRAQVETAFDLLGRDPEEGEYKNYTSVDSRVLWEKVAKGVHKRYQAEKVAKEEALKGFELVTEPIYKKKVG